MKRLLSLRRLWWLFRQASPVLILFVCLAVLWPRVQSVDFDNLQQYWREISVAQWALSGVFTIISFWAVGQYDVIAHRQLNTGLPAEQARRSGMAAIALSQTLGFGVVTATLARWRMLRGFGPGVAALVTAFVSLTFMVMILAITVVMCLILPSPDVLFVPALAAPFLLLALLGLAIWKPRVRLKGFVVDLPGLRAIFAAAGWALIDVVAACAALWILIPVAARPDLVSLLPVFCLALSAGLLSGTPGGAGPFELVLLAFTVPGLPAATPESALLVAVFGFRLVYFAIPAILSILQLLVRPAPMALWRDPLPPTVSQAPRAETAVIRQNGGEVMQLGSTHAGIWPTGQAFVAMFDPFEHPDPGFFDQLEEQARSRNRYAMIYKSGRRTAHCARQLGWHVLHSADDALLNMGKYRLDVPERAGLRRKLRKAEKAGIRVRPAIPRDVVRLQDIDESWQSEHGTARGGTMGRFCQSYLQSQRVFVAEQNGQIVAFVTFQVTHQEWALDIMRHMSAVPDGTMHALVHHGIEAAQAGLVTRVSLAAVPACPDPTSALWRAVMFRVVFLSGGSGLRQFKSAFAPDWKPLYLAAPTRLAFCMALMDIVREVFWPAPVLDIGDELMNPFHDEDEKYEVASNIAA